MKILSYPNPTQIIRMEDCEKIAGTIFTRIVADATINLSPARARLLIKGDYYLRAALINFGE